MEIIAFRLLENYSANIVWVFFSRSEALSLSLNQNFDQNHIKIASFKRYLHFLSIKMQMKIKCHGVLALLHRLTQKGATQSLQHQD